MEADVIVALARARRGAELLDAALPGWADHINLDEFDMRSCFDCALGQLFGEYIRGKVALKIQSAIESGFDLPIFPACAETQKARFSALTAAWVAEIEARRANVDAPR